MTRYLTVDELVYINEQLHSHEKIHTIVDGKRKVRDMALLEAAAARPASSAFGEDAYPTLTDKAAALLHALTRNHPFADGNKRTATIGMIFMLECNGQRPTWGAPDALERVLAVAEGREGLEAFAAWLPLADYPAMLEPEAAQDMAHIRQILDTHAWLLAQLAER